jgi:hypothetical protein
MYIFNLKSVHNTNTTYNIPISTSSTHNLNQFFVFSFSGKFLQLEFGKKKKKNTDLNTKLI